MGPGIVLLIIAVGYLIYLFSRRNKSDQFSSSFTKIDDKNFIVDGEFVSFEEDTPLLRMQQKQEDDKQYRQYEQARRDDDRKHLQDMWEYITDFIVEFPHLNDITESEVESVKELYDKYVAKCDKLHAMPLTKKQFAIKEINHLYLRMTMTNLCGNGLYYIHNEKTARYKGNMMEKLKEEFEAKNY